MTEPERCKHEMLIDTCGICSPRATSIEAPDQVEIRYWFVAKFDGSCTFGNHPVREGDRLARTTDGDLVCERCPGVAPGWT
jgi:hypothetical protein